MVRVTRHGELEVEARAALTLAVKRLSKSMTKVDQIVIVAGSSSR